MPRYVEFPSHEKKTEPKGQQRDKQRVHVNALLLNHLGCKLFAIVAVDFILFS